MNIEVPANDASGCQIQANNHDHDGSNLNHENEIQVMDAAAAVLDPNADNQQSNVENDDATESMRHLSKPNTNGTEQVKRSSSGLFECKDCPYTTKRKCHFINHKLTHGGDRAKQFKCNQCDYASTCKHNLNRHQRTHDRNPKDKLHKCPHCDRRFTKSYHLTRHITRLHNNNQRLYNCVHCLRRFEQQYKKKQHELRCQNRRYECHLCKSYVTAYKTHMCRHMRTHSGARPYKCAICNKCFNQTNSLKKHLDFRHSRINK